MIRYTAAQQKIVLDAFGCDETGPQAHTHTWSRRSYAPMHIHSDAFADVRAQIRGLFPDHVIAFDVVFESRGNETAWHCDYESLGPFEVPDAWRAVRDAHFVSVHANLTGDGGSLLTLGTWPLLSWVHYQVIVWTGIYSAWHLWVTWLCLPVLSRFARVHPNAVGLGNAFHNMRLHSVSAGAPRVSYVVRLVRRGVTISRASVREGMARSAACSAFGMLLDRIDSEESRDVTTVNWGGHE